MALSGGPAVVPDEPNSSGASSMGVESSQRGRGAHMVTIVTIETPGGPARVHLADGDGRGLVALGHGAGGGVDAPDLVATAAALTASGWTVARVEQPYRVRGGRFPERAPAL